MRQKVEKNNATKEKGSLDTLLYPVVIDSISTSNFFASDIKVLGPCDGSQPYKLISVDLNVGRVLAVKHGFLLSRVR